MVFAAAAVAMFGVILKLIAAEPTGWFLVPLAAAAGLYHVVVHARAARAPEPPIGLAAISDVLLSPPCCSRSISAGPIIAAIRPMTGVARNLGWSSEHVCTLMRGFREACPSAPSW